MDGESSVANTRRTKVVPQEFFVHLLKRRHLQREERRNEKTETLLELLEGCSCRMVNTKSTTVLYGTWISDSDPI